jgi:hypothetical protein
MDKSNVCKENAPDRLSEAATKSILRPGDFSLGSLESRAAARAILDERGEAETVIQIVFVSPDGDKTDGPKLTPRR